MKDQYGNPMFYDDKSSDLRDDEEDNFSDKTVEVQLECLAKKKKSETIEIEIEDSRGQVLYQKEFSRESGLAIDQQTEEHDESQDLVSVKSQDKKDDAKIVQKNEEIEKQQSNKGTQKEIENLDRTLSSVKPNDSFYQSSEESVTGLKKPFKPPMAFNREQQSHVTYSSDFDPVKYLLNKNIVGTKYDYSVPQSYASTDIMLSLTKNQKTINILNSDRPKEKVLSFEVNDI